MQQRAIKNFFRPVNSRMEILDLITIRPGFVFEINELRANRTVVVDGLCGRCHKPQSTKKNATPKGTVLSEWRQ
ncbi:unknown [Phocaeicola coprophilus CAG:333]|nr:unknown [Phocaeicola coprophilus CAG:333]